MLKKILMFFFSEIISDMVKKEQELLFKSQMERLKSQELALKSIFDEMEISVDVHRTGKSWAVISIAGERADYIKFIDMSPKNLKELQDFLRNFERSKIDATPDDFRFLKINR